MPLETAAGCDTPPPPTLIGNGAHPFTIPRVRDSNHLTSYLFAFPRDHRDSFISPKERDSLLVLFLAVEHASWRVELKTVDCKWYGRVAHVFCQMNHFKRIDGVEGMWISTIFGCWLKELKKQKERKVFIQLIEIKKNFSIYCEIEKFNNQIKVSVIFLIKQIIVLYLQNESENKIFSLFLNI